jgi:hypothetical protein
VPCDSCTFAEFTAVNRDERRANTCVHYGCLRGSSLIVARGIGMLNVGDLHMPRF